VVFALPTVPESVIAAPDATRVELARSDTVRAESAANHPVTVRAASIVTEQVPVPVHVPPVHPTKTDPDPAVCVTVRLVPIGYVVEHVDVQAVPPDGVTLPVPEPDRAIVSAAVLTAVNVAVVVFAASAVIVQEPVPVHAPDQPPKMLPVAGVAVRVTVEV
jgi:hypothetical protein